MFTGIIETTGKIVGLRNEKGNLILKVQSSISNKLKAGQSVSHDGICLTVVSKSQSTHTVIAVEETLNCTSLNKRKIGDVLNLERAMRASDRFEGHIVQGHIDTTGKVKRIGNKNGSYLFTIMHQEKAPKFIYKGSVCINGVSLTIAKFGNAEFSVAIIPYTFDHTTFRNLKVRDAINIEWDLFGKYIYGYLRGEKGLFI